jgi:hypothetical protein
MSQLTPEQLAQVENWASDGANLNQVQDRLKTEFGITLTYLDARLLMLDVGVRIKDKPREAPPAPPEQPQPAENQETEELGGLDEAEDSAETVPSATISMSADQITIPGALISGKVTFSDGVEASWFLDQMGRLGLNGAPQGYKPPQGDVPQFQQQLDLFLQRAGL